MSEAPKKEGPPIDDQEGYSQILRSSALVGGSSILSIGIGIVRTKAIAILLGPAGFGAYGVYASISSLAQCIAGMGTNSSGVRQIAYAAEARDHSERVARTAAALKRVSLILGLFGALLLIIASRQVSLLTFGNDREVGAICLLSLAVLFQVVSNSQIALIQGTRRILDFAKVGGFGALGGMLISIPVIYLLRWNGIVLSLVAVALTSLLVSWWYSRKIRRRSVRLTRSELTMEISDLLKLGSAFMASGLVTLGAGYAARVIVMRNIGLEATGLYQSAWTLGGVYVGFILQAMGADFFPRLTAAIDDNEKCNRLVNEQTQIGMLLAGPGVIVSLSLAPLVLSAFYSQKFFAASGALRWICLGTFLQVVAWPMSYIIAAKGRQTTYIVTELVWGGTNLGLTWLCAKRFGITGTGLAFFVSYVIYFLMLVPIVGRLTGFRMSAANRKIALLFSLVIMIVFACFYSVSSRFTVIIGILSSTLMGIYSIRVISKGSRFRQK